MSELATLARPYAVAVFKRAQQVQAAAQWSEMLGFLAVIMQDSAMQRLIDSPRLAKNQLLTLLLEITESRLDQEGRQLLKILVENRRLSLLPFIARLFEDYRAEAEGYIDVAVTSAYFLNEDQYNHLVWVLQNQFNRSVRMSVYIDPSLLGGILVKAGDKVIDASVRGRLQKLAKTTLN